MRSRQALRHLKNRIVFLLQIVFLRDNVNLVAKNIAIEDDLHAKLKTIAAKQGRKLGRLIADYLREALKRKP